MDANKYNYKYNKKKLDGYENTGSDFDQGLKKVSLPPGGKGIAPSIKVRLLHPLEEDLGELGYLVGNHFNMMGDITYTPCYTTFGQTCPICSVLTKHKESTVDLSNFKRKGKGNVLAIVLDGQVRTRKDKQNVLITLPKDEVVCLELPPASYYNILRKLNSNDYGDFAHPVTGSTVKLQRKLHQQEIDIDILQTQPLAETEEKIDEILAKRVVFSTMFKPNTPEYDIKVQKSAQTLDEYLTKQEKQKVKEIEILSEKEIDDEVDKYLAAGSIGTADDISL